MHTNNHIYQERTQIRKARNVLAGEIRESFVEEDGIKQKEEMEKRGEGIPGRDGKSEGTELCVPGTTRRVWLKYRRPVRAQAAGRLGPKWVS